MTIIPTKPVRGETLQGGCCGFITREKDFVGDGIEWFERFEGGLPFVHAFVVESPGESSSPTIIEAHAGTGVHRTTLDQYPGQRDCQCFIRMPMGWTPDIGEKIVAAASAHRARNMRLA